MKTSTKKSGAAHALALRVVRPLNAAQQALLDHFGDEWKRAPLRTSSATLLALQARGLIEGRTTPGAMPWLDRYASYTGYAYEWRRRPNAEISNAPKSAKENL